MLVLYMKAGNLAMVLIIKFYGKTTFKNVFSRFFGQGINKLEVGKICDERWGVLS